MSLYLAFYTAGFGTCLKRLKDPVGDNLLRSAAPIEGADQVITLIAIGILPERFNVAVSPRRPLDDVLTLH